MIYPPRVLAVPVFDLGRASYADAYAIQLSHHEQVLAARESGGPHAHILLVEHDPPVITISRRPDARAHLLATSEALARAGVTVEQTDRGGDITYHGPGQLVVYPIVDLNALRFGLHEYMRLLETAVIDTCAAFGIAAARDPSATGVWVSGEAGSTGPSAKICAMGVRVRRWVTLHGLALNVATNLDHFDLIVPCGLAGRTVTSLEREYGPRRSVPPMSDVKARLVADLTRLLMVKR